MQEELSGSKTVKLQKIIMVVAVILLALSLFLGFIAGLNYAHSKATYENALSIREALKYYREDQDMYPSADQFYGQRILVPYYMEDIPTPVGATGSCASYPEFKYTQATPRDFKLVFCLKKKVGGLSAGLHQFTEQGLQ